MSIEGRRRQMTKSVRRRGGQQKGSMRNRNNKDKPVAGESESSDSDNSDSDDARQGKYNPIRNGIRDRLPLNDAMDRGVSDPAYYGMKLRRTRMPLRIRGHIDMPIVAEVRLPGEAGVHYSLRTFHYVIASDAFIKPALAD